MPPRGLDANVTAGALVGVDSSSSATSPTSVRRSKQGQAITLVTPDTCLSAVGCVPVHVAGHDLVARGFVEDPGLHVLGAMPGRQDEVRRYYRPGALPYIIATNVEDVSHPGERAGFRGLPADHRYVSAGAP